MRYQVRKGKVKLAEFNDPRRAQLYIHSEVSTSRSYPPYKWTLFDKAEKSTLYEITESVDTQRKFLADMLLAKAHAKLVSTNFFESQRLKID